MQRPRVIINCAASADGKISLGDGKPLRISSEEDMARVHRLRNNVDAILVGINTVLQDNPKLTVKERYLDGTPLKNPVRIVLDSRGRTPDNALVLDDNAPTIIVTNTRAKREFGNAEVIRCGDDRVDLRCLMARLVERGLSSLMVEGGSTVISSFIRSRLFDELCIYYGSMVIGGLAPGIVGGYGAVSEEEVVRLNLVSVERLGSGVLHVYHPCTMRDKNEG